MISSSTAIPPGSHCETPSTAFPVDSTWPELARARALLG